MGFMKQGSQRPLGRRQTLHDLRRAARSPKQPENSDQTLVQATDPTPAQDNTSRLKKRASTFGIKNALTKLRIIKTSAAPAEPIWTQYELVKRIGSGGNGLVDLCFDTSAGILVAVKTLTLPNPAAPLAEATILQNLGRHGNIVRYYNSVLSPPHPNRLQLIFEYCPRGDLLDYLDTLDGAIPELFLWHVFKHVACGLAFLHSRGIVHGDIKPANILLTAAREGERFSLPKIADFGAASCNPSPEIPRGHIGTPSFQPPEADYRHGPESDIWSLGSMMHELVLGRVPMQKVRELEIDAETWFGGSGREIPDGVVARDLYKEFCFYQAGHVVERIRIDCPSEYTTKVYSPLLNHFMMRTLDLDWKNRITASQLYDLLPKLEAIVQDLHILGQPELLDNLEDREELNGREAPCVTDSQMLRQLFERLARHADWASHQEMRKRGMQLLFLMDEEDHFAAFRALRDVRNFWGMEW
ncbi:hypothetical protein J4E93_010877 [Alternaria ventricosa]|uniref:uncharacterized protein n=1 Tax=Alternaria ventricosa TaxID=1187951 RepID=UPI0020C4329F|nr:uncharacterized protein J4E93_010877 [Alternaria ventricosa]KAI4636861.1 hypothetical protein J4E93_010877 [Alternaria ventricosa]